MQLDRRRFLKLLGGTSVAGSAPGVPARRALGSVGQAAGRQRVGVLVDIPNCIGCRKCEYACREAAGFDVPPIETFEDKSVMAQARRPQPHAFTVVNRYPNPRDAEQPVYVKNNCLHCIDPACASACLVGALRKTPEGPVVYDAWKCMGCRYCMVACPFEIPKYEYDNALTPQVRKCTLCAERLDELGGVPACVKICPQECLIYGRREDLLALAREKIRANPDRYVDHIYGEQEAGGTSWLYLSSVPFENIGFLRLSSTPPPQLTEPVQHGIFKFFMPPIALYALLGLIMWLGRQDGAEPAGGVRDAGIARASDDRAEFEPPEPRRDSAPRERIREPARTS